MKVSVIVATYRREALLCQTLRDALALQWSDLEIIVVDQTETHTPETRAFLHGVRDRLVHLSHRPPGVVAAENRGLAAARGDVVLFLDDDVRLPDPRLIAQHVENYADASIGGVAGRVLDAENPVEGRFDPRSQDRVSGFFHTGWTHPTRCEVTTAPGANASFRRDVLLAVGGADERFRGQAFRWENDLCLRVRGAGYRVMYDPRPTVHHFYRSPAGNENHHLHGRGRGSHRWYRDFFHNQIYVSLKHMPRASLGQLLWRLYRGHVLNRPYLREGVPVLAARHAAMLGGTLAGWRTYQGWRRDREGGATATPGRRGTGGERGRSRIGVGS
ncbi:MAG: glycosyltransferase family 2 protein [Gammaproteobacteria bacterium]